MKGCGLVIRLQRPRETGVFVPLIRTEQKEERDDKEEKDHVKISLFLSFLNKIPLTAF
jgi:hypothetical protein